MVAVETSRPKAQLHFCGEPVGLGNMEKLSVILSFQVKKQHFLPVMKKYINPKSMAPYFVKLAVDLDTVTRFSLSKDSLQRNLGTVVDRW